MGFTTFINKTTKSTVLDIYVIDNNIMTTVTQNRHIDTDKLALSGSDTTFCCFEIGNIIVLSQHKSHELVILRREIPNCVLGTVEINV